MQLKKYFRYLNADSREVWIAGATAVNPDWLYSIQGDWYVQATGQRLSYVPGKRDAQGNLTQGEHIPLPLASRFTIVKEIGPDA